MAVNKIAKGKIEITLIQENVLRISEIDMWRGKVQEESRKRNIREYVKENVLLVVGREKWLRRCCEGFNLRFWKFFLGAGGICLICLRNRTRCCDLVWLGSFAWPTRKCRCHVVCQGWVGSMSVRVSSRHRILRVSVEGLTRNLRL